MLFVDYIMSHIIQESVSFDSTTSYNLNTKTLFEIALLIPYRFKLNLLPRCIFPKGIKNVIIGFNLILLKLINLEVLTCKVQCKI
jgi:glycopeptide antibiotics resistance protein